MYSYISLFHDQNSKQNNWRYFYWHSVVGNPLICGTEQGCAGTTPVPQSLALNYSQGNCLSRLLQSDQLNSSLNIFCSKSCCCCASLFLSFLLQLFCFWLQFEDHDCFILPGLSNAFWDCFALIICFEFQILNPIFFSLNYAQTSFFVS